MVNFEKIPKSGGVYLIQGKNCKIYVGSSINLKRRFKEHYRELKNKNHENPKLQNYINKYGIESISFCILKEGMGSLDEIRNLEKQMILELNSVKDGFNCTDQVLKGDKIPENIRKIISNKAKIRQSSKEVKFKLREQNLGVKNPASKFTIDDIISIRKSNLSNKELALLYKVNYYTIVRIKNKITYSNIE